MQGYAHRAPLHRSRVNRDRMARRFILPVYITALPSSPSPLLMYNAFLKGFGVYITIPFLGLVCWLPHQYTFAKRVDELTGARFGVVS